MPNNGTKYSSTKKRGNARARESIRARRTARARKATAARMKSCRRGDPVSYAFDSMLDKTGLGVRPKIILVFFVTKIIPLAVLAFLIWNQYSLLGGTLSEIAVNDATGTLEKSSTENVERMATDTAERIASFLYDRDGDIRYAATLKPDKAAYSNFINSLTRGVANGGKWALSEDGMSWVQTKSGRGSDADAPLPASEETLKGGYWRSRPAEGFSYEQIPLFDEITFVDTSGNEKIKVIAKDSPKKSHPMEEGLGNISEQKDTYAKSENYWGELKKLQPGDIYVSGVKGYPVASDFTGMYTPKQMVIASIGGAIAELDDMGQKTAEGRALRSALAKIRDDRIAGIDADMSSNEAMMQSVIAATLPLIDKAAASARESGASADAMAAALKDKISALKFDPENEAFAGGENPMGERFEGIVRWAAPVVEESGNVAGYVTLALNHDHLMEFADHQTPLPEQYTDLPSAYYGNYASLWDSNGGSISHPRHQSILGTGEVLGMGDGEAIEGWMRLTDNGGSGSFRVQRDGEQRLTAAAAVPYYTGQYAPSSENGLSKRGFAIVAVEANFEDLTAPAGDVRSELSPALNSELRSTLMWLIAVTVILAAMTVIIAIWLAGWITNNIAGLVSGISRFRAGERDFRFNARTSDEFGLLAESFDGMADTAATTPPPAITDPAPHPPCAPPPAITDPAPHPPCAPPPAITDSDPQSICDPVRSATPALAPVPMDIAQTVREVERAMRPICDEKHLDFEVIVSGFEPQPLVCDRHRLVQVLKSLLDNAVKFTPAYGRIDLVAQNMGSENGETTVGFAVRDTGIGIPEEMKERIFAPPAPTTLAAVKRIVEAMGGRIDFSTAEGEGSEFTFVIRMKEA